MFTRVENGETKFAQKNAKILSQKQRFQWGISFLAAEKPVFL